MRISGVARLGADAHTSPHPTPHHNTTPHLCGTALAACPSFFVKQFFFVCGRARLLSHTPYCCFCLFVDQGKPKKYLQNRTKYLRNQNKNLRNSVRNVAIAHQILLNQVDAEPLVAFTKTGTAPGFGLRDTCRPSCAPFTGGFFRSTLAFHTMTPSAARPSPPPPDDYTIAFICSISGTGRVSLTPTNNADFREGATKHRFVDYG